MSIVFIILAALTLVAAVAAMSLRSLVHCALCLVVAFGGLAAFYLKLGAPFVGWAQVLVYVGAVAILVVFAILLTRSDAPSQRVVVGSWWVGVLVAALVFCVLARAVLTSSLSEGGYNDKPALTVREIGDELMTRYVLPLEATGLLLTAATIGAVIIALHDPTTKTKPGNGAAKSEAEKLRTGGGV
jgi:NADH:ubiquinone oxidoreductase subunit 6 (subunit J)